MRYTPIHVSQSFDTNGLFDILSKATATHRVKSMVEYGKELDMSYVADYEGMFSRVTFVVRE